jgi:hypothetical protein|tara:strand:- start:236 stop:475 length:240 start_codon:yes stop_codon:yes gene_type:complete
MIQDEYLKMMTTFASCAEFFISVQTSMATVQMSMVQGRTSMIIKFDKKTDKFIVTGNDKGAREGYRSLEGKLNDRYRRL